MKQRKSPVALITVAVFAGIGLMIAAKPFGEERLSSEEKMQLAQKRAMEQQKAQESSNPTIKADGAKEGNELTEAMQKSLPANTSSSKKPGSASMRDDELPPNPVVIKQEEAVYVPKPNSASTTSQWYDKK